MSTSIPSFNQYRVAAIQYEPTLGEKEKNVTALLRLVEEAAQHDARLIVLPEMATTGYCWESRSEVAPYVEPIPGPTTERFQQVAARYGSIIALGLPEVDPTTDVYYNSLALLGRSEEHTSELQSQSNLVCRLLLEQKKTQTMNS